MEITKQTFVFEICFVLRYQYFNNIMLLINVFYYYEIYLKLTFCLQYWYRTMGIHFVMLQNSIYYIKLSKIVIENKRIKKKFDWNLITYNFLNHVISRISMFCIIIELKAE